MSIQEAGKALCYASATCTECGKCIQRCEVLERSGKQPEDGSLTVGAVARTFAAAFSAFDEDELATPEGGAALLTEVARLAEQNPDLVFLVRRCCMCDYCTQVCPTQVDTRATFAALRELFTLAGVVTGAGFESTQIDTEWHIFSVYRAVYGVHFQDLPQLSDARERGADTLFFPGCPLASYAPDLAREVFGWLDQQGINAVFSAECCGSPLKAAGRMDRAVAYKRELASSLKQAGIKRVVCVCPGCAEELAEAQGIDDIEMVALPRLLAEAGVRISSEKIAAFAAVEHSCDQALSVSVFDSCHDRTGVFGGALRSLFDESVLAELPHGGEQALCCGASGAVALVDPAISERRAHRILDDEAVVAQAQLLVANCPTCSYTFAAQRRMDAAAKAAWPGPPHANYLDLVFDASFDWDTIFSQLEGMWNGEYGAWVCQQLS